MNQDESLDASELLPWEHHRIPGGICGEREEDMAEGLCQGLFINKFIKLKPHDFVKFKQFPLSLNKMSTR